MPHLRVAAAQLNLTVGDLDGNAARMLEAYELAEAAGADLVAFPELAVTGYPPEDLLLKQAFVGQAQDSLAKLAARTGRTAAIVGFPERDGVLFNAAAICAHGQVLGVYRKHLLPNYAVFDEERYFEPWSGDGPLLRIGGARVAVTVCEDAWSENGPIRTQARSGAELVVNINASPYYAGRLAEREHMLAERAIDAGVPILYVNLVGGQDELVFDGASLLIDETGSVLARATQFDDALMVADVLVPDRAAGSPVLAEIEISPAAGHDGTAAPAVARALDPVHEVYEALVVGTRDYVRKNGFTETVIGLSGGIDSALVAAIATDALGPENVVGVMMPSRFSSEGSVIDSAELAANLRIRTLTIPIEPAHRAFLEMLAEPFAGLEPGLAEENVQARVRGTILMTLSNKLGWLVLTTGNKSEMAVGYATLYGDMAGGFAVVKDVPKLLVYALCRDRNTRAGRILIPTSILDKPPSAELRPDQLDTDSLPAYEVLDPIIEGYVEDDKSIADLEAEGHDPETVRRVAALIDRNEYKRRQAPPGVRVSPKAFGKDRRLPITNRWSG
ncbi:MAG TPA: NAD+ synthase [Acidimicrobiia bacterium]|nr:NAD+ synthase [Acidimicrobiia bacterium]